MSEIVRVAQLSDTHFLALGEQPEGLQAYDTSEAFDAVFRHHADQDENQDDFDLVVVTGDIADHGRADQYEVAAAAFARFRQRVNVTPGNHDFDEPFRAGSGGVGTERLIEFGPWAVRVRRFEFRDDGRRRRRQTRRSAW